MGSTRRGLASKATAVSLLLLLTACGSEGATSEQSPGAAPAATVTLTDQPFCDQLDTAPLAEVLGLPTDRVKLRVDREVGDTFEGPDEEAAPPESVSNLCVFGSTTSQFVVSVQPDASTDDVQSTIDDLASLTGEDSTESCEATTVDGFGDPSAAYTCTAPGGMDRVRVAVTGLVGGSKFFCSVLRNQGAGAELTDATLDACRGALDGVTTAA